MDVLRSSPYLSRITRSSSRTTPSSSFSSANISLKRAICLINSSYSPSSFSRSNPVSARRRISTIACACGSSSPNRSIRRSFAIAVVFEERTIFITSSILSSAIKSPLSIWARSSALLRSYCVRLVTTSS